MSSRFAAHDVCIDLVRCGRVWEALERDRPLYGSTDGLWLGVGGSCFAHVWATCLWLGRLGCGEGERSLAKGGGLSYVVG